MSSWLSVRRDGTSFLWCVQDRRRSAKEEFSRVIKYVSERPEKLLAMMEREEDLRKQMFQEISDLDEKIPGRGDGTTGEKRILEEMLKERRNAEVEEGRVTVSAGGGVTRQAVAGSRSSDAEVELLVADVDGRRRTEDTVVAGSGFTQKAIAGTGTVGNLPSVEERGRRKRKETDESVAVGGGVTRMTAAGARGVEKEGAPIKCGVEGRPKDTEEEQSPLSQAKASPQNRRAVIRVESAETQDYWVFLN